ncbi:putative NAD(P)-binding protein [Isoptericola sp. CG 20/1183]|uniref:NAD(P)-binding protein n=1 Tax=Isoptericola halotolerans TaxID=300560 RepID=A0ABX5EHL3_9MICO|nr:MULTISPECIES: NAD(P)-binding protein [Isoptericola]PRZ08588.1 putative NAD(P)-binding protein [Isoptericola halotolerans]PRZ10965.1 putative NAD(P)-binding protein [Isoptericola sp. CG 20/1183]
MAQALETDYLVIGAGAAGMAFTDAVLDHSDAHVTLVDRRDDVGGHWRDAYPFVRLHQASPFYGVASTPFGGAIQTSGPEAGLRERATGAEVCAYYERVRRERFEPSGRFTFLGGHDVSDDGRVVALGSGAERDVRVRRRVVDARYLSPRIPALEPPPFEVSDGVTCVPVGELPSVVSAESFVVVGSGKTATDAIVWLLGRGVSADAICWVRPRDPWMLDRAVVQPDPAIFLGMAASMMEAGAAAASVDEFFLRLEDDGVMLRLDRGVLPTMARVPTLARWELELLRTVENVVRLGHVRRVSPGLVSLERGDVRVGAGAVAVHCAAKGLRQRPAVPIWSDGRMVLQPVRAGFPCFGAALVGYVEATRPAWSDAELNAVCRSTPLFSTPSEWVGIQAAGALATAAYMAEPDVAAWSHSTSLNPTRVTAADRERDEVVAAIARFKAVSEAGVRGMVRLGRA